MQQKKVIIKKQKKINIVKQLKSIFFLVIAVVITLLLARYVSQLLFDGKNSLDVYSALKKQKENLNINIKRLQSDNARLQKEYFELKNLEPEE